MGGALTGSMAALMAYMIARPPVRETARNPELDGRTFLISALIHVLVGFALTEVMTTSSAA